MSDYYMGEKCIQNVTRNPEQKTPLGRFKHTWEDNIKSDRKEILSECGYVLDSRGLV